MLGEEFEIVLDDVVPDQIRGSFGESVQSCKGRGQSIAVAAPSEGRGAIGAYRADGLAALKVDGKQAGKAMRRQARPYPFVISPPLDCHWCFRSAGNRSRIRTQRTSPFSSAEAAAARYGRGNPFDSVLAGSLPCETASPRTIGFHGAGNKRTN